MSGRPTAAGESPGVIDIDRSLAVLCEADPEASEYHARNLRDEGFDVVIDADPTSAAARVVDDPRSGVLILDIHLPNAPQTLRNLRNNPRATGNGIIVITHSHDLELLESTLADGADDFLRPPFELVEFLARVKAVVRRTTQMIGVSPLTGLPGNQRTEVEIDRWLRAGRPTAVAHVDLDNFKPFNDHYGFKRGDHVIAFAAHVLQNARTASPDESCFVGHIGGDDFVVVVDPAHVESLAKRVIDDFDAGILDYYDREDAIRGYIEVPDRRGDRHAFSVVSISLGIATNVHRTLVNSVDASQVAAEMKEVAKGIPGSAYRIDRRRE